MGGPVSVMIVMKIALISVSVKVAMIIADYRYMILTGTYVFGARNAEANN